MNAFTTKIHGSVERLECETQNTQNFKSTKQSTWAPSLTVIIYRNIVSNQNEKAKRSSR